MSAVKRRLLVVGSALLPLAREGACPPPQRPPETAILGEDGDVMFLRVPPRWVCTEHGSGSLPQWLLHHVEACHPVAFRELRARLERECEGRP